MNHFSSIAGASKKKKKRVLSLLNELLLNQSPFHFWFLEMNDVPGLRRLFTPTQRFSLVA